MRLNRVSGFSLLKRAEAWDKKLCMKGIRSSRASFILERKYSASATFFSSGIDCAD